MASSSSLTREIGRGGAIRAASCAAQFFKLRALGSRAIRTAAESVAGTVLARTLHTAAVVGDAALVRILVAEGHDPRADDRFGTAPLNYAAACGHAAVVAALVEAGADVSAPDSRSHSTPLHSAAMGGSAGVIRALLAAGAARGARDKWGSTPLDRAVQFHEAAAASALRT